MNDSTGKRHKGMETAIQKIQCQPRPKMLAKNVINHITTQSFSFAPRLLPFTALMLLLLLVDTLTGSPTAAARMAASRCFARSSPLSAARTYHTFASSASRRQPIPISVKYPIAYCALTKSAR